MAPQASGKSGHLSPDHHRIGSRADNGISLEQARGVFPVLRDLITLSYTHQYKPKTVPGTISRHPKLLKSA
jgi:hypothetical protein